MATRTEYGKENRFRARREVQGRTKGDGENTKSQSTTIATRKNIIDTKTKRTTGSPGTGDIKEEKHKVYNKFGAPPKKVISADKAFISPLKSDNVVRKTREEKPRVPRKPVVASEPASDSSKGNTEEESKPNVSKLKHIFDETIANETIKAQQNFRKPRPISEAIDRLKSDHGTEGTQAESPGRPWSLPNYYKKTLPPTPNHKPHVSQGIAARRALFESGGSNEDVSRKEKRSPSLLDLVPDLKDLDINSLSKNEQLSSPRSRTRSDPGTKRPMYFIKSRKRFLSDTKAMNGEYHGTVDKLGLSHDDSVLHNPPAYTRRLFKSHSVDHIIQGPLLTPDNEAEKNVVSLASQPLPSKNNQKEEKLPLPLENDAAKPIAKSVDRDESPSVKTGLRFQRKEVPKDDFFDETPGRIREACWKDEEIPQEESAQLELAPSTKYDFITRPDSKPPEENKLPETLSHPKHDSVYFHDRKSEETPSHNEETESSGDESTGSVVEHSDVDEDRAHTQAVSPVSLLFTAKPLSSALAAKEKDKKRKRSVEFAVDTNELFPTYSAEEYDRANDNIDPVTASAEWELEKRVEKMDIFSVDLGKDERGLGLSIIGLGVGTDTGVEKLGIFVKSLTEGGAAALDGRIQVNDQIIEVDGISLVGVTQQFAAQTLKNTSGIVRFLMGRDKSRAHLHVSHRIDPNVEQQLEDLKHKLIEAETKAEEAEKRASLAEKMVQLQKNIQKPEPAVEQTNNEAKKAQKALAEMTDKVNMLESDLAVSEAENDDMVRQLEERKGLYLILEKKYHITKNKLKELEDREQANAVAAERSAVDVKLLQDKVKELEKQLQQAISEKESKQKEEYISTVIFSKVEQKTLPTGKEKEEVQEEVIENGLVSEMEKALSNFQLSWDSQRKELDAIEPVTQSKSLDGMDLNCVPETKTLSNDYLLEKKRLAEAQQKKHKPTRASWAKSLDDDNDMFGDHEASDENEEEISSKKNSSEVEGHRSPPKGPGLVLPSFPVGGFKLRSTGKNLYDESAPKGSDSPPQEIRASFPLSHKEETRNIVVENLLEKQLSKADIKVSSLPTTALDRMDRETREPVDEEDSECFSGSTNSLDEIEEATRRIDSDLASSQASSRGSSPFLPPAMPLLQMKSVPVMESYNEAAIDVPPELLAVSGQTDSGRSSPSLASNVDGQSPISSPMSDMQSPGAAQLISDWDTDQVHSWLIANDLEEYAEEFNNKNIDGKQLLNLDSSRLKAMGVSQNHRAIFKKKVKEMKAEMEREQKARKQREKEQKTGKKEGKFEKMGFMKKKGVYNINN